MREKAFIHPLLLSSDYFFGGGFREAEDASGGRKETEKMCKSEKEALFEDGVR